MAKLRMVASGLKVIDARTVKPATKQADAELQGAAHRQWREHVMVNAGWRCEAVEDGRRCERSGLRGDRMFADHIVERRDGGSRFDPLNGQCLCGSHHTRKTMRARARRLGTA